MNINKINILDLLIALICLVVIVALPPLGVMISFVIVILYLLVGKDRKQKLKSIGFTRPKSWLKTIFICLLLAIVIETSFQVFFNPIIEKLTTSKIDLSAYDNIRGNFPNYLIMLMVGWVVGGFIEEILFRGFLITRLLRLFTNTNTGNWFAIVLTSTVFGFSHLYQGWSGVISTGLIAALFGIIFIKNNKILWYSILTHGFVNVVGLTLIYLNLDKYLSSLILPW